MGPYYAVREGRHKGVYRSWDECRSNVSGYSGAQYAKFDTADQASAYMESQDSKSKVLQGMESTYSDNFYYIDNRPTRAASDSQTRSSNRYQASSSTHSDSEKLVIYTDGACHSNGQRKAQAGYGFYAPSHPKLSHYGPLSGPLQTNQRAELEAIRQAVTQAPPQASLEIRTDSRYAIGCMGKWGERWEAEGITDRKNLDIINDTRRIIKERQGKVQFSHVKGHSGDVGNEMADRLANMGARS